MVCHQFWIFHVSGKNTLFLDEFFQMFNFVHSRLSNNFIKLGGELNCVMAFNLTDEAENILVMWGQQ